MSNAIWRSTHWTRDQSGTFFADAGLMHGFFNVHGHLHLHGECYPEWERRILLLPGKIRGNVGICSHPYSFQCFYRLVNGGDGGKVWLRNIIGDATITDLDFADHVLYPIPLNYKVPFLISFFNAKILSFLKLCWTCFWILDCSWLVAIMCSSEIHFHFILSCYNGVLLSVVS